MATRHKSAAPRARAAQRWSVGVTRTSNALDLKREIFTLESPAGIAASLKRAAEASSRRATAFQSAMSMLNFYINRGGSNLSKRRKGILERAKRSLRIAFHRKPSSVAH